MEKIKTYESFVTEGKSSALSGFIREKAARGAELKAEFADKHGYLKEDADKLAGEIAKMELSDLQDFYNERTPDCKILENRTDESEEYVKEFNIGVFDLLNNEGKYDMYDAYVMVVHGKIVVSFGTSDHPLKDRKYVDWFVYDLLEVASGDMENVACNFGYDPDLDEEENRRRMEKGYCTPEMFETVKSMYDKYMEKHGKKSAKDDEEE